MIEIKKLRKVYNSKSKYKCIALNDISLNLPSKGLVFVCGKSGSGKSTLLNMLGGLDDISDGIIRVDGNDLNNFSNKEYDDYRNSYVGFVFQDFCLIENFNVYDNIKLSLDLNGKVDNNKIDKVLEEVDLEGYGKRYPKELSGGQKQRVAIARCLVKEPKLILADEPTGNLDNKTAKQILSLLKDISKERLIVIVSHSIKDALEYGDRIIELSDGNIISDKQKNEKKKRKLIEGDVINLPSNISDDDLKKINNRIKKGNVTIVKEEEDFIDTIQPSENKIQKIEKSKRIPFVSSCKMAAKFLKGNKASIVITSLLLVMLTLLVYFGEIFSSFDETYLIKQALQQTDDKSFSMNKGYYKASIYNKILQTDKAVEVTQDDIDVFYENGYEGKIYKLYNSAILSEYTKEPTHQLEHGNTLDNRMDYSKFYVTQGYGVLETDEEFLVKLYGKDGKLSLLAGSIDEDSNQKGIIITDYFADALLTYNSDIYLANQNNKYENIVNIGIIGARYNVSAIIDTDYEEKYEEIINEYKIIANLDTKKEMKNHIRELMEKDIYKEYINDVKKYLAIGYSLESDYEKTLIDNALYMGVFYRFHNATVISADKLVAESIGWSYMLSTGLVGNEISIGSNIYNKMFGTNVSYENQQGFEEKTITIKMYNSNRGEDDSPLYSKVFIIKQLMVSDNGGIALSEEAFKELVPYNIYPYALYFDDALNAASIHDIGEDIGLYSDNYYFESVYTIINIIDIFSDIFSFALMVIISLIFVLIVTFSIRNIKKKIYEIGVLRALGGNNFQVSKTFILQVLYLCIIVCVVSSVLVSLTIDPINDLLIRELAEFTRNDDLFNIDIISFNSNILIMTFAFIFLIALISSLIPIVFIRKIKPINIMKSKE